MRYLHQVIDLPSADIHAMGQVHRIEGEPQWTLVELARFLDLDPNDLDPDEVNEDDHDVATLYREFYLAGWGEVDAAEELARIDIEQPTEVVMA